MADADRETVEFNVTVCEWMGSDLSKAAGAMQARLKTTVTQVWLT